MKLSVISPIISCLVVLISVLSIDDDAIIKPLSFVKSDVLLGIPVTDSSPVELIAKLFPSILTPPKVVLLATGKEKSTTSTYSKPSLTSFFNLIN